MRLSRPSKKLHLKILLLWNDDENGNIAHRTIYLWFFVSMKKMYCVIMEGVRRQPVISIRLRVPTIMEAGCHKEEEEDSFHVRYYGYMLEASELEEVQLLLYRLEAAAAATSSWRLLELQP